MDNTNMDSIYGQLRLLSSNENDLQVYTLQPGINSIGSDIKATLRIYGKDIQPLHCFIEVHENRLATLSATSYFYPTKLNRKNLNKNKCEILKSSDVIELGGTQIVYENTSLTKEDIIQGSKIIPKLMYFRTPQKLYKSDNRFSTVGKLPTQFERTRLTNMLRKKSLSSPAVNSQMTKDRSAKKQITSSSTSNIPQLISNDSVKSRSISSTFKIPVKTPARLITSSRDNTDAKTPATAQDDIVKEPQHSNVSKSLFKTPANLMKSKAKKISIVDLVTPQSTIKTRKRYPTTPRNKLQTNSSVFEIKEIPESSINELISDTENSDVLEHDSDNNASSTESSSFEYISYSNESSLLEKESDITNISGLKLNLEMPEKCEESVLINDINFANSTSVCEDLIEMPTFQGILDAESTDSDKESLVEIIDDSTEYSSVLCTNSSWKESYLTNSDVENDETKTELKNVNEFPKYNLQYVSGRKQALSTPRTRHSSKLHKMLKIQKSLGNDLLQDVSSVKLLLKTPRSIRSTRKDLRSVTEVKRLTKTPKLQKSPKHDLQDFRGVKGVKQHLKTPKSKRSPKNDVENVRGVKHLLKTSKPQRSPKNDLQSVSGIKRLMKTPKVQRSPANDLQDIRGVKRLMKTPRVRKSPKNDLQDVRGVRQLLKTPKPKRSPKNDLEDVRGVKKLLKTPKLKRSPKNDLRNVTGVKRLMKTPKIQRSPKNDLQDVRGVKKLLKTPKPKSSSSNDLQNVSGVKQLMKTPKIQRSPENDLRNVSGIEGLMKTPKVQEFPESDFQDISGLDTLPKTPKCFPRNDLQDVSEVPLTKTPENDLRNVSGVKQLFETPELERSSESDLQDVGEVKQLLNTFSNNTKHSLKTSTLERFSENYLMSPNETKRLKAPTTRSSSRIALELKSCSGQKIEQLIDTPESDASNMTKLPELNLEQMETTSRTQSFENKLLNVSGLALDTSNKQRSSQINLQEDEEIERSSYITSPKNDKEEMIESSQISGSSKISVHNEEEIEQSFYTTSPKNDVEDVQISGSSKIILHEDEEIDRSYYTISLKSDVEDVTKVEEMVPSPQSSGSFKLILHENEEIEQSFYKNDIEDVTEMEKIVTSSQTTDSSNIISHEDEEIKRSLYTSFTKNNIESVTKIEEITKLPEISGSSQSNLEDFKENECFIQNTFENIAKIEHELKTTDELEFSGKKEHFQDNSESVIEFETPSLRRSYVQDENEMIKITNILARQSSSVVSLEEVERLLKSPIIRQSPRSVPQIVDETNQNKTQNITNTPSSLNDTIKPTTTSFEGSPQNSLEEVTQILTTSKIRKSQRDSLQTANGAVEIEMSVEEQNSHQDNFENSIQYVSEKKELKGQNAGDNFEEFATAQIGTPQSSPRSVSKHFEDVIEISENDESVEQISLQNRFQTECGVNESTTEECDRLQNNNVQNETEMNKLTNISLAQYLLLDDLENTTVTEQLIKTPKMDRSCERKRKTKTSRLQQSFYDNLESITDEIQFSKTQNLQRSPKNDLQNVIGVKELMKTPKAQRSPKLTGVKRLLRTPRLRLSIRNDLQDVTGVKRLLTTPKVQKSPTNDLQDVTGVKQLMKTPKTQRSPQNSLEDITGVKQLMKTPRVQKSPKNDLQNVVGVKELMKTPKAHRSPQVTGVKRLLTTPKVQKSPTNDLQDITGVKRLLKTPRLRSSPKNDLQDVTGVRELMKTPIKQQSLRNTLEDVTGIKRLMRTPKVRRSQRTGLKDVSGVKQLFQTPDSSKNDFENVSDAEKLVETTTQCFSENYFEKDVQNLSNTNDVHRGKVDEERNNSSQSLTTFDMLKEQKPIRTYRGKSLSPIKTNTNTKMRSSLGGIPSMSPNVFKWVKDHNKYFSSNVGAIDEVCATTQRLSINEYQATPASHSETKETLNIIHTKKPEIESPIKTESVLQNVQNKMIDTSKKKCTTKRLTNNFDDLILECNFSKDFMESEINKILRQTSTPKKTHVSVSSSKITRKKSDCIIEIANKSEVLESNKIAHENCSSKVDMAMVSNQSISKTRTSKKRISLEHYNNELIKRVKISEEVNVESDIARVVSEQNTKKTRSDKDIEKFKDDGDIVKEETLFKTKRTKQSEEIKESSASIRLSEVKEQSVSTTKPGRRNLRSHPVVEVDTVVIELSKVVENSISSTKRSERKIKTDVALIKSDSQSVEESISKMKRTRKNVKLNLDTVNDDNTSKAVEEPISKSKRTRKSRVLIESNKVLDEPTSEQDKFNKQEKISKSSTDANKDLKEPISKLKRTRKNKALIESNKILDEPISEQIKFNTQEKISKSNTDANKDLEKPKRTRKNRASMQSDKVLDEPISEQVKFNTRKEISKSNTDAIEDLEESNSKPQRTRQTRASVKSTKILNKPISKAKGARQNVKLSTQDEVVSKTKNSNVDKDLEEPVFKTRRARKNRASMEPDKVLDEPVSGQVKFDVSEKIPKSNLNTIKDLEEPSKPRRTRKNKASVEILDKRNEIVLKTEGTDKISKSNSITAKQNDISENSEKPILKTKGTKQNTKSNPSKVKDDGAFTKSPQVILRNKRSKTNVAQDDTGKKYTTKNKQTSKLNQIASANNISANSCESVEVTFEIRRTRRNVKLGHLVVESDNKNKRTKQKVESTKDETVSKTKHANIKKSNSTSESTESLEEPVSKTKRGRKNTKAAPVIKNNENSKLNQIASTNKNTSKDFCETVEKVTKLEHPVIESNNKNKRAKQNVRSTKDVTVSKTKPVNTKKITEPIEVLEKPVSKVGRPKKNVTFNPVIIEKNMELRLKEETISKSKYTRKSTRSSTIRSPEISNGTVSNIKRLKNNTGSKNNSVPIESPKIKGRIVPLKSNKNNDDKTTSNEQNMKGVKSSVVTRGKRKWESSDADDDKQNITTVKKIKSSLDQNQTQTLDKVVTRSQIQKKTRKR